MKIVSRLKMRWILVFLLCQTLQEAMSAVTLCRAKLTGNSGTFTSPHYPNENSSIEGLEHYFTSRHNQKRYIRCQWEIEVEIGKAIQLKFGDFDINAALDDCDKGEVDVFSGTGKHKERLDTYCAGNHPGTVIFPSNSGTVVFRRPKNFQGNGFLISYIAFTPKKQIPDFITCSEIGTLYNQVDSYSVTCPSGCANITHHVVYGKLPYRENSHICRSAVHAGAISDEFGGKITVKRETGKSLYFGSTANNVTTVTGPLADFQINFPNVKTCRDEIEIAPNQLSASSYLNETDFFGKHKAWPPGQAVSYPDGAWFPGDISKPQWLQVDLKRKMNITGIFTKGSTNPYTYTKSYRIKFSENNITWYSYKEEGQKIPKVFGGNKNSYLKVRNNFVKPTILARYIRVYPNSLIDEDLPKQGLQVAFTGCKPNDYKVVIDDIITPPPPPPTTPASNIKSTSPSSTVSAFTVQTPAGASNKSTAKENASTAEENASTAEENVVAQGKEIDLENYDENTNLTDEVVKGLQPESNEPINKDEVEKNSDLSERSIIIIGIVAALAVTSILLATLVLVLVRKRKKEPKHNTMIPKLTSQTNVTYNAAIGMPYAPNNNNPERKKSKKTSKKQNGTQNGRCIENQPLNGISIENSFARDGHTLQYDQQRQLLAVEREHEQNRSHFTSSYSKAATCQLQSLEQTSQDGDQRAFTSDDDDHEYQVILDPVLQFSSKSSCNGSSLGAHSKDSESGLRKQEIVWGKAGDGWSKGSTPEKEQLISSGVTNETNSPPLFHSESFSRKDCLSTNKDSPVFFLTQNSASKKSKRSSSNQFLRSNSRGQSQNSAFPLGPSYQRFSSSSTGSSAHSRSDGFAGHRRIPHYPAVSKESNNLTNRDCECVVVSSSPTQLHSGSNATSLPNHNEVVYPPVFSPSPNGSPQTEDKRKASFTNGQIKPAEANLTSRNLVRNDYDQLYRRKTPSEANNSFVSMTNNNYDQLNLNTAV